MTEHRAYLSFAYRGENGHTDGITGTRPTYSPDGSYLYVDVLCDTGDASLTGETVGYDVTRITWEKNMPGPFACVYCGQDTTECRRAAKSGTPCGA